MTLLDRLFLVVFARYRRRMGASNDEAAWRRASNSVTLFFVFPVAVGVLGLATLSYWWTGLGSHAEHRKWAQIVAGAVGLGLALLLDRRFQRYRSAPPLLGSEESRSDCRLVLTFRVLSIGLVVVIWIIGVLIRKSELGVLNGF